MSDNYTLADVLRKDAKFSTFVQAFDDAGIIGSLRENGPFTLLAPTNAAFDKLPEQIKTDLLKPENKTKFIGILNYHILQGKMTSAEIYKLKRVKTIQGQEIVIENSDGIKINGARLGARNFEASNGIFHAIDTVLAPAATAQAL